MTTRWKCDKCGDITQERQADWSGAHCESIPESGWGCEKCNPLGSGRRVKIEAKKKGKGKCR